jgi:signal transduction histidine kinase
VGRKMLDFFRSPSNQTSILMQGEQRIEWIRYCEEKTELFGSSNFYGETIPDRTYHLYKFSNGYIGAASPGEISTESWELLKRATAVFSFAYTRFRDLQMAETSARTAVRQASLDRVRAEISSMRHADDLDRITPLFFHELTTLGIPFIRCGVFIIQEKQEIVEAYLSSPDGNSLGVLKLPYQASELTYKTVEAWRKGLVYTQHWNKEDFVNWINQLMEQDQIQDSRTYQGSAAPPESLDLHFVPFTQGMLYVGAEKTLDENELELVQALAKAFSIAYARYEDFVKLEQAKAEIESAMSELKATQSQLVQQEKLASLGQLTAGIAHEIKNPLNFVNNFSEVSIELVDEAIEERSKGPEARDESLVDEILVDIKSNLKKVHEHGSRANGIVTSMLQHSRGGSGKIEPTDLNALVKEYVNLSFHGMRAGKNPIDVEISFDLDPEIKEVPLIKEDFIRVIINLCNNAFDAMRGKVLKTQDARYKMQDGSVIDEIYQPTLHVGTSQLPPESLSREIGRGKGGYFKITIQDNGPGIPDEIKDKILQPFFTTKKGTEGTGLGLSITNDIIKAHGGELKVETLEGVGTTFIIDLEKKQ